jgi:hypothetical protein
MKNFLKSLLPESILFFWYWLTVNRDLLKPIIEKKLNVSLVRREDFYSPLPDYTDLLSNVGRWNKPSELKGIRVDVKQMLTYWNLLTQKYKTQFEHLPKFEENQKLGFGVGYTKVDARTSFYMIKELKPKKYLEIGSGLSTYYAHLASNSNLEDSNLKTQIHCIEPYPFDNLYKIEDIEVTKDFVQNIPIKFFEELEDGDVLFIDSSHAAKIDSDVYYEILDILPSLKKGVYVHIHDIPFPYNFPFPPELYIFNKTWPQYWNEPAFVQAFLSFNDAFEIVLSVPLLKHHFNDQISSTIPDHNSEINYSNAIGSLWLKKIK